MKLLLYCTKGKPYLLREDIDEDLVFFGINKIDITGNILNGTIPCECDYEISEVEFKQAFYLNGPLYITKRKEPFKYFSYIDLLKESCLQDNEIFKYLGNKNGKAIHIKNLKIFEKPKRLNEFTVYTRVNYTKEKRYTMQMLNKAPQNMCYVWDEHNIKYALISIRPEWLCKILNGEKKIEVRRKVLKEMVNNEIYKNVKCNNL